MSELASPEEGSAGSSPPSAIRHSGPDDRLASLVLVVLALVLYVFGFVYALDPGMSASSIQSIALAIGLHTPPPPSDASPQFYSWVGFTFSYMMAAGTCSLLASRPSPERMAYLNILLVLKGTSSLGGLVLFVRGPEYAFYLSTFLVDGLLFLLVWFLRVRLRKLQVSKKGAPTAPPSAVSAESSPGP